MWSVLLDGRYRYFADEKRAKKAAERTGGQMVRPDSSELGARGFDSRALHHRRIERQLMPAETDRLSGAAANFTNLVKRAGEVADKLNSRVGDTSKMVDHVEKISDDLGNVHAQLVGILGQVTNLPPA